MINESFVSNTYTNLWSNIRNEIAKAIIANINFYINASFGGMGGGATELGGCRENFFKNGNTVHVITRECINGEVQGGICFEEAISSVTNCGANLTVPYSELPESYDLISSWHREYINFYRDSSGAADEDFANCVHGVLREGSQCLIDERNRTENMVIAGIFGIPAGICIVGCAVMSVVRYVQYRKYKAWKLKEKEIELKEIKIANHILGQISESSSETSESSDSGSDSDIDEDVSSVSEKEYDYSDSASEDSTTEVTANRSDDEATTAEENEFDYSDSENEDITTEVTASRSDDDYDSVDENEFDYSDSENEDTTTEVTASRSGEEDADSVDDKEDFSQS